MPHLRRARLRASGVLVAAVVGTGGAASAWTAPAPAPATPVRDAVTAAEGEQRSEAEQRGERALASLEYPWRELGYAVEFREYTGGTLGTANSRTKRIVIYVKKSQSHQSLRITIAHELGHALDFEHATVQRRRDYRTIRGLDQSARWFPCDRCTDYQSHAGDWAEVFAYWIAGPGDFRSEVAGPPTKDQLRRLTALFRLPRARAATPPPSATPRATPSASASPSPSRVLPTLPERTPAAVAPVHAPAVTPQVGELVLPFTESRRPSPHPLVVLTADPAG